MKNTLYLVLLILLSSNSIYAQESQKPVDNYTIKRLIVSNNNDEVLIVKYNGTWNIPALRFNTNQTYNEALMELAHDMGIEIETPRIAGIFSFRYDYKSQAALRMFYVTSYKNGIPKPKTGWDDIKWISKEEYLMLKEQDVYSLMAAKIIEDESNVWGGAFLLYKDESEDKIKYKVSQDFYKLR